MKSYLRFLWRNKLYTVIEVAGMAVALSFSVMLISFIVNEKSCDKKLSGDLDRIYVCGNERDFSTYGNMISEDQSSDIEQVCSIYQFQGMNDYMQCTVGGNSSPVTLLAVTGNFFGFFGYPLLEGGLGTADEAVVTEEFALRMFGGTDVIGRQIVLSEAGQTNTLTISGISGSPGKSTMPACDIICSDRFLEKLIASEGRTLETYPMTVFIMTIPECDIRRPEKTLGDRIKETDFSYTHGFLKDFTLTQFHEIRFVTGMNTFPFQNILDRKLLTIFILACALLLVFSILNYISLTVAMTSFRAKEMATRRLLGDSRMRIIGRYISESFTLVAVSSVLGLMLTVILSPYINTVTGLDIDIIRDMDIVTAGIIIALIAVLGLSAGIIPAMIISVYSPIDVVRGTYRRAGKGTLGKVFIGVQCAMSIILIALTFSIYAQTRHMTDKDMGYETDNIVYADLLDRRRNHFIEELEALPFVEKTGSINRLPVNNKMMFGFAKNGEKTPVICLCGDLASMDILGIKVQRSFSEPTEYSFYVCESTAEKIGLGEYEGLPYLDVDDMQPIDGTVSDFECGSALVPQSSAYTMYQVVSNDLTIVLAKVSGDAEEAVKAISALYREKGYEDAEIGTLDSVMDSVYEREHRQLVMITVFLAVILVLTALSILATSTYYRKLNMSSAAVRKVFGCSDRRLFMETVWNFASAYVCAALAAVPVGYICVERWLSEYSYRIGNGMWIYAAALVVTAAVAFVAVSWQAWKLAVTKPAEAIKTE